MEKNSATIKKAIKCLAIIDPRKPMGTELFNIIARLTVSVAIDMVALRKSKKGTEIYLTKRLPGQSYSGKWHIPGTIIRPGEMEKDAFLRLEKKEFKTKLKCIRFIGYHNNIKEERGHFINLIFCCKIKKNNTNWFFIDNLPNLMVDFQKKISIPMVIKKLKLNNNII